MAKKCPYCGKEFTPTTNKQKYCCDECRIKWFQEERKRERAERKAQKIAERSACVSTKAKGKPAKKPKVPLSEVMKMAAAEHLSYGEIVIKYGL